MTRNRIFMDFCLTGRFGKCWLRRGAGFTRYKPRLWAYRKVNTSGWIFWGEQQAERCHCTGQAVVKKHTHIIGMDMENLFYLKRLFLFASDDIKGFFWIWKRAGFPKIIPNSEYIVDVTTRIRSFLLNKPTRVCNIHHFASGYGTIISTMSPYRSTKGHDGTSGTPTMHQWQSLTSNLNNSLY